MIAEEFVLTRISPRFRSKSYPHKCNTTEVLQLRQQQFIGAVWGFGE